VGRVGFTEKFMAVNARREYMVKKDNLINEIENYLKQYVVLPNDDEYRVLALYSIHTWALDAAQATPYLYVYSPEPGSGKTTLLEVLGSISNSPELTANLTAPALMNLVDSQECTLLFDELDMVFASSSANNKQIQGVLNAGYRRGGKAYRVQGEGVRKINVFCPKVLAGVNNGKLPDTLVDRAIPVQIRRKHRDQQVKPFYLNEVEEESGTILDKIEEWVSAHSDKLSEYRVELDLDWNPRQVEIATPLLAIAAEFGVEESIAAVIDRMVDTYKRDLASQDKSQDFLRSIAALFVVTERNKVFTEELLEWLDLPNTNKGAKMLAEKLAVYRVESENVRIGNKRRKGFELVQFAPYLDAAGLLDDDGTVKEDAL
jgi:hypothetical protein